MAPLKADRVEPELGFAIVTLDVDMRRFVPVARVEVEPVRTMTKDSRHNRNVTGQAFAPQSSNGPIQRPHRASRDRAAEAMG
jgi:hypothetical protein